MKFPGRLRNLEWGENFHNLASNPNNIIKVYHNNLIKFKWKKYKNYQNVNIYNNKRKMKKIIKLF